MDDRAGSVVMERSNFWAVCSQDRFDQVQAVTRLSQDQAFAECAYTYCSSMGSSPVEALQGFYFLTSYVAVF